MSLSEEKMREIARDEIRKGQSVLSETRVRVLVDEQIAVAIKAAIEKGVNGYIWDDWRKYGLRDAIDKFIEKTVSKEPLDAHIAHAVENLVEGWELEERIDEGLDKGLDVATEHAEAKVETLLQVRVDRIVTKKVIQQAFERAMRNKLRATLVSVLSTPNAKKFMSKLWDIDITLITGRKRKRSHT